MSNKNETDIQVIENASPDEIQTGDHVVWEWVGSGRGVSVTERREGIAHHRDWTGGWCTEDDGWITDLEDKGFTITIRRPLTKEC